MQAKLADILCAGPNLAQAKLELDYARDHQIQILYYLHADYPKRLKACEDCPLILYYKGTANLNTAKVLAIVGTRQASEYGKRLCFSFLEHFKASNILVVSGLAYGIDIYAHQASLDLGLDTVGVLAHGLDKIYPVMHYNIAQRMIQKGGLITEYLPHTAARKENFPKRNRIIAGLCDALIVVEAAEKGGALISARLANSYHKEVFAFPGRCDDRLSAGCLYLIKTYQANLISSAIDVIQALNWHDIESAQVQTQLALHKV